MGFKASMPFIACHVESAITAIPFGKTKTFSTPGDSSADFSLKDFKLPPLAGKCLT